MLIYSRGEAGDNSEHHKFKRANHKGRAVKSIHRLDYSEHRGRRLETRDVCPQFFVFLSRHRHYNEPITRPRCSSNGLIDSSNQL